ncbi:MAG: GDP-mannose 4,6-dehydratase [Candidatus Zixiibacteriota bacterium]|nr:MAG: GDP-mannose 4,6-dehydratase [candidate division Zixibacteria bacterium]
MKSRGRVILTGVAGFAGSYLAELLLAKGYEIYGLLAPGEKPDNIRHIKNDLKLERFNITRQNKISSYIKKIKPHYLFHLAAFASVGQSFRNERLTYDVNFTGSLNIFEAASGLHGKLKKLVFISSSECYGIFTPKNKILMESQPLNPISPYGISKAAAEHLALYYRRQYRLPAVIARSFNHTGPRQSEIFVVPSFCRQIAIIERRRSKAEMQVGNLSVKRDLSDVRDIVNGYYLAAVRGKAGDTFQFSSGRAVTIKTVLDGLLRLSARKIIVRTSRSRFRRTDIPVLRGGNDAARKKLGWQMQYSLQETLRDTLEYWREKVEKAR